MPKTKLMTDDQPIPPIPPTPPDHPEPPGPSGPPQPNHWVTRWTTIRSGLAKATGHSPELTPGQQITRRTFVSFTAFTLLGVAAWKSWF